MFQATTPAAHSRKGGKATNGRKRRRLVAHASVLDESRPDYISWNFSLIVSLFCLSLSLLFVLPTLCCCVSTPAFYVSMAAAPNRSFKTRRKTKARESLFKNFACKLNNSQTGMDCEIDSSLIFVLRVYTYLHAKILQQRTISIANIFLYISNWARPIDISRRDARHLPYGDSSALWFPFFIFYIFTIIIFLPKVNCRATKM